MTTCSPLHGRHDLFRHLGHRGQLITPYFVSRKLQLNAVVVFLTVALWAWLWSVIGMIVAVPILVVMRVLADHIPGLEKFGNFLAGEDPPALEDEDEEQARDLVEAGDDAEDSDEAAAATAPWREPDGIAGRPRKTWHDRDASHGR